jgi:tyrosine-protein phosphatase YwqE
MKPTTLTNNDARKFPFVEYHYQASNLENVTSRCMKMSKSFRDVSRDYFATEENYDFLSNAAIFVALIASALVPIVQLGRELPLF